MLHSNQHGRLCYFECDMSDCPPDSVHFDKVENNFVVDKVDPSLGYLSGSFTHAVAIRPSTVSMFAFLCFDHTDPLAVGQSDNPWYDSQDVTEANFAGSASLDDSSEGWGRYYGPILTNLEDSVNIADSEAKEAASKPKLLSTFLQLCCSPASQCLSTAERDNVKCSAEKTRIKNYYSPQPTFPLLVFHSSQSGSDSATSYKVSDYDGHPLQLLPPRLRGAYPENKAKHVSYSSYDNNNPPAYLPTALRYADDPPAGPEVKLYSFPDAYGSTGAASGFNSSKATVVEVQDLVWQRLESPNPRSMKDCIIANNFANAQGVMYTDVTLAEMTREQHAVIVRDNLCSASQWPPLAATLAECRALDNITLLDLCPNAINGTTEYDIYQEAPKVCWEDASGSLGTGLSNCAHAEYPQASTGGTVVQTLFTPYVQTSSQCPASKIPQWDSSIETEVDCYPCDSSSGESCDNGRCHVALKAHTGDAASEISFEEAPGSHRFKAAFCNIHTASGDWVWHAGGGRIPTSQECRVQYDVAPCGCCNSRSLCQEDGTCNSLDLKKHHCRFAAETPSIQDVGLSQVVCFVAKASFCNSGSKQYESEALGHSQCTTRHACYSVPLCVRFNYKGRPPAFVAPTPLEANALDDSGRVIPAFTDVGACMGSPVVFDLAAVDPDAGDQVRIILDDEERGNSFFFESLQEDANALPHRGRCGQFTAYSGKRAGNNSRQHSLLHLRNAEDDSSIVAPLNADIEWASSRAEQSIIYTLSADHENGVFIRSTCDATQMCRQRLLNADRTICGYALDNSRSRYRRWMGGRTSGHNFGSYSSKRHCWRIRLQAPPAFVTNKTGCVTVGPDLISSACTPFAPEAYNVRSSTDNPAAYARIKMPYTSRLDVTFTAFDPNPDDRVSLSVLEEPGIPSGMSIGRVVCEARDAGVPQTEGDIDSVLAQTPPECLQKCGPGEEDADGSPRCECKQTHSTSRNPGQFCPADLKCNRAKIRIKWQPTKEDAGRGTFKVCVIARDSSTLCEGVSPSATSIGWYGEKQCMLIEVIQVAFRWHGAWINDLMQRASPFPVYVGCTLRYDVLVNETTSGVAYGLRVTRAGLADDAAVAAERRMVITDIASRQDASTVSVTPMLGSEGASLTACFVAGDKFGGVSIGGMCTEDGNKGCNVDSDCAAGHCVKVCVTVEVQKCRYCVGDGDPLRTVMKDYFFDTNWLKLWSLNDATHSELGTECLPGLDCDQNVGGIVAIDNPQLMLGTPSDVGKRILWAGVLYAPPKEQSFREVACMFKTSLASIAKGNPDMLNVTEPGAIVPAHHPVCIVACNDPGSVEHCAPLPPSM